MLFPQRVGPSFIKNKRKNYPANVSLVSLQSPRLNIMRGTVTSIPRARRHHSLGCCATSAHVICDPRPPFMRIQPRSSMLIQVTPLRSCSAPQRDLVAEVGSSDNAHCFRYSSRRDHTNGNFNFLNLYDTGTVGRPKIKAVTTECIYQQ